MVLRSWEYLERNDGHRYQGANTGELLAAVADVCRDTARAMEPRDGILVKMEHCACWKRPHE